MWLESPGTAVLDRSTVPACNDRRVPSVDGIINDRDKPTYRQKAWPSAISSTASPTWINLGLNPDLSGKNAATSVLGCDVFTFRYKKGSSLSFAAVVIVGLVKTCSTEDQHCLFSFPKKYFMRVDTLLGLITSIFALNILKLPGSQWDVRRIFLSVLVH